MARKYTSLYKDDPIAAELEAGIRGTDVYQGSPYMLSSVPEFEGMKTATTDYNRIRDLYGLYMGGGFDAAQDDFVTPPGVGDPSSGDEGDPGSGGTVPVAPSGPVNTPEEQRLIDEGIGLQIGPGEPVFAPGEMPVTQAEMDEFNRRPVNTDYRNQQLVNQGIGVRVGDTGPVFAPGEAPVTQYEIDQYNRTPGSRVTPIDPTQMIPQISTYTPRQTIAGDVYAAGDYSDVAGTLGDPREKMNYISEADAADPKGLLSRLGLDQLNVPEAILKTSINAAVGRPITLFIDMLKDKLPKMDPRQKALNEFYKTDDIGRVAKGELMAGYNPVSGGLFGDTQYGLQEAYQDRIDTIEDTLKRKGLTDTDIADIYAGAYDPEKTGIESDLTQKLVDLKEEKEKEKARLDLFSGDIGKEDTGDAMLAELEAAKTRAGIQPTDPFLEIPDRQYRDTTANPLADIYTGADDFSTTPSADPFVGTAPGVDAYGLMGTEYEVPYARKVAPADEIKMEKLRTEDEQRMLEELKEEEGTSFLDWIGTFPGGDLDRDYAEQEAAKAKAAKAAEVAEANRVNQLAEARKLMTKPGLDVNLKPNDPNIPDEIEFALGEKYTTRPYYPYHDVNYETGEIKQLGKAPDTPVGTEVQEVDYDEHYDVAPDAPPPDYDTVGMVDEYDEFEREFPELYSDKEPETNKILKDYTEQRTKSASEKWRDENLNFSQREDYDKWITEGATHAEAATIAKGLGDKVAQKKLNQEQLIEYDNLVTEKFNQKMQENLEKRGDPHVRMSEEEDIKHEVIDQILDEDIIKRGGGDDVYFDPPSAPTTLEEMQEQMVVDRGRSDQWDPGAGRGQVITKDTPKVSTYDAEREDDRDTGGGGGGCVIATHAVNSGAFTADTKREAVRWCVKNLHRTWWGEAVRRGYRYYGQKAINEGNAKNHYQEFKDYVAFGTGKRRTLKTAWTFVYRTVQFFIRGLFNA